MSRQRTRTALYVVFTFVILAGSTAAATPSSPPLSVLASPSMTGEWILRSFSPPAFGNGSAAAYDPARSRTVVFGAISDPTFDHSLRFYTTWLFDGSDWVQASPDRTPEPTLGGKALAFDSRRNKLVLFGGGANGVGQNQTWEWDGRDWTQRSPASSPTGRGWPAMAYDSARDRVVLFGGKDSGNVRLSDTWEYDGSDWTRRSPATAPSGRAEAAMAFDATRGRILLFGGGDANSYFGDTWEYDGTNWIQRSPLTEPTGRSAAGLAYDSQRDRTVLFGGGDRLGYLQDTWEYDGTNWSQRLPATAPGGRKTGGLAYDSLRGRTVLFGGNVASANNETWEWDGTNWTQWREPAHPKGGTCGGMTWDSRRNVAVLMGDDGGTDLTNTWEYDGVRWTKKTPPAFPPTRGGFACGFDTLRGETILFGGSTNYSNAASFLNDTWAWNGSNWTRKSTSVAPPVRIADGAQMAFDSGRGKLVLFGGYAGNNTASADTWEWDGSAWAQRTSTTRPGARWQCALAYDPLRSRTVLFGGVADYSQTRLRDTWEWDGVNWTPLAPATSPPDGPQGSMVFDAGRGHVQLIYGGGGLWETGTWEWNGANWNKRQPIHRVPQDATMRGAYDPLRGRLVAFGGFAFGNSSATNELPDVDSGTSTGPSTGPSPNTPGNRPPTVLVGSDQVLAPGSPVTVAGTASDLDGDPLTYSWARSGGSGPEVALTGADTASASFTPLTAGTYIFTLTVSDGKGGTAVASVAFSVRSDPSVGAASWTRRMADPPLPRTGPGMVYDSLRRRVVMFGGRLSGYADFNDTWEWDGSSWTQVPTPASPPTRTDFAMAYDETRRVTVLFGGFFEGPNPARGNAQDTWEYDGSNWTQKFPSSVPPARRVHSMAYDPVSRQILLFGGCCPAAETWAYDGTNWKTLADDLHSPPGRGGQCASLDPLRRRVVLYAGDQGNCYQRNDTWEWDGARWSVVNPGSGVAYAPWPPYLGFHGMAYSEADASTIVFGGYTGCGNTDSFWKWDGARWSEIVTPVKPLARSGAGVAYDKDRKRVVLFGGSGAGSYGDTWEWDGKSWVQRYPTPRTGAQMAYDSARGRTVMFGGNDNNNWNLAETWEWDGAGWTQLYPATSPPPADFTTRMAYDSARRRAVLICGGWPATLWEWDGAVWTKRATMNRGWTGAGAVYDQARGVTVQEVCGQAHEWDGVNWRTRPASGPPCAADNCAYDSRRSRMVLYANFPGTTWEFDGLSWLNPDKPPQSGPTPPSPGRRDSFGIAYDSARGRTVLFGGNICNGCSGVAVDGTFEWDGAGWQASAAASGPTSRFNHGFAYDDKRGRCVLFGGMTLAGSWRARSGETWEYQGDAACALTVARIQPLAALSGGPGTLQFDGTASTGPGIAYGWSLASAPDGVVALSASGPTARYAVTKSGIYNFQLTVTSDGGCRSSANASFTVGNAPPTARTAEEVAVILPNAGVTAQTTTTLVLDGSESDDPNGDPITYLWELVSWPAASTVPGRFGSVPATGAILRVGFDPSSLASGRLNDAGAYVFRLTVRDSKNEAGTATVQVTALDPAGLVPRADAGPNQRVVATVLGRNPLTLADDLPDLTAIPGRHNPFVKLDGRGSADSSRQPRPLGYVWTAVSAPEGSQLPALTGAGSATPGFTPNASGAYEFQLVVSNGTLESFPARTRVAVQLRDGTGAPTVTPPVALPLVRDRARPERSASPADPPLAVQAGDVLTLDGRSSFVPDGRAFVRTFLWRQTAGPGVSLSPQAGAAVSSFVAASPGDYGFTLTVTDSRGLVSPPTALRLLVTSPGSRPPLLSLVASASTTPGTAPDLGETPQDGASAALHVTLSDLSRPTVRLGAYSPDLASGQLQAPYFRVGWRQVGGPSVLLFPVDAGSLRPGEISAAQFEPVTGRVHVFEAGLQKLDSVTSRPSGPATLRRVQVAVDTPFHSVPTALARLGSVVRSKSATRAVDVVTLDGRGSFDPSSEAGGLLFRWVQLAGPEVRLSDPCSAVTTFVTPDLEEEAAMRLVFALTVSDNAGTQSPPANVSVDVTPTTTMDAQLALGSGLSLVGMPAIPTLATEYRLSELAAFAGGVSVIRLDAVTGRFAIYDPTLRTGDLPVTGAEAYFLLRGRLPSTMQQISSGRRWPLSSRTRHIRRGLNLIAYPRGLPAGARASSLATLTGAGFVVTPDPDTGRWTTYVVGLGATDFALRSGTGYLIGAVAESDVVMPSGAVR